MLRIGTYTRTSFSVEQLLGMCSLCQLQVRTENSSTWTRPACVTSSEVVPSQHASLRGIELLTSSGSFTKIRNQKAFCTIREWWKKDDTHNYLLSSDSKIFFPIHKRTGSLILAVINFDFTITDSFNHSWEKSVSHYTVLSFVELLSNDHAIAGLRVENGACQ